MADLQSFNPVVYKQGTQIAKALGDAITQRTDVAGGICFSLCCQWIELHQKYHKMGSGTQDRIDAMAIRIKDLMADSIYFYRAMNSQAGDYAQKYNDKSEQKNAVGKKYGISFGNATTSLSVKALAEAVDVKRGYTQTSFSFKIGGKTGRHAICSYKSSGKIFGIGAHLYVFDPNFGEFRVPGGQIKDFYTSLFLVYQGKGKISSIITYQVDVN